MKIIENNNCIDVTCPLCKSKLGVHVRDIHYNEIAHRCSTFEVKCAACNRFVGIDADKIPAAWLQTIVPD